MLFYIGAAVFGLLRWPWWTVALLAVARGLWLNFIDLPALNGLLASPDGRQASIGDEPVLIGLVVSIVAIVVVYALALAARTLWDRSRRA